MVNPECDVLSSAVPYYMLAYRIYQATAAASRQWFEVAARFARGWEMRHNK